MREGPKKIAQHEHVSFRSFTRWETERGRCFQTSNESAVLQKTCSSRRAQLGNMSNNFLTRSRMIDGCHELIYFDFVSQAVQCLLRQGQCFHPRCGKSIWGKFRSTVGGCRYPSRPTLPILSEKRCQSNLT